MLPHNNPGGRFYNLHFIDEEIEGLSERKSNLCYN